MKRHTVYPIVIETKPTKLLIGFVLFVAVMAVCGVLGIAGCLLDLFPSRYLPLLLIDTVVAGPGLVALWLKMNTKVVFDCERVTKTTLFSSEVRLRENVEGYRRVVGTLRIQLLSCKDGEPPITAPRWCLGKAKDWFASIPDIDAVELSALKRGLREDPRYGATPPERKKFLKRLRTAVNVANWTGYSIAVWGIIIGVYISFVVVAAFLLPFVGLGLLRYSHGYVHLTFDRNKDDPRPDISPALGLPGLVLMLRSLNVNLLDGWLLAAVTGVIAVAGTLLLGFEVRTIRSSWAATLLVFLGAAVYGYGAVSVADISLDTARPLIYRTMVADLEISGSKSKFYRVTVKPWGPQRSAGVINVSQSYYRSLRIGEEVCVRQHPGSLGIRWYELGDC